MKNRLTLVLVLLIHLFVIAWLVNNKQVNWRVKVKELEWKIQQIEKEVINNGEIPIKAAWQGWTCT